MNCEGPLYWVVGSVFPFIGSWGGGGRGQVKLAFKCIKIRFFLLRSDPYPSSDPDPSEFNKFRHITLHCDTVPTHWCTAIIFLFQLQPSEDLSMDEN